ncbi:MAG: PspC domain-containing protein [Chloroflexota bacterium]
MRRIQRSNQQKVIAGVAGGLAEYFDVDPLLIRLAFIVLAFANGIGLIAYLALWILAPQASASQPPAQQREEAAKQEPHLPQERRREGWLWVGVLLVLLGVVLLPNVDLWLFLFKAPPQVLKLPWSLILIVVGVIILWRWRRQGT